MKNKIKQNKKWLIFSTVIALSLLFMDCLCMANQDQTRGYHSITQFKNGAINWTTGNISAVGKASPKDNNETSQGSVPGLARADANRQIINILKQIKINPSLSVDAYASKNDIILAGIEKTARDAVIAKQYYTSALAVEIIIETSMFGGFLQLILPEEIRQIPKINPEIKKKKVEIIGKPVYSGLIVDATGLGVEPVLNPVIVSEQGHDIYSSAFISRDFAVQYGVAKYLSSMDQALKDKRTGNHPLILKGLRKQGKPNTAIVISMSDYSLLEKATERHRFLKECRIIIVKD